MWRGAVVKVSEEEKTWHPTLPPPPFIILKKWKNESEKEEASYWSAAQSQNSVLNYHTVTQNTIGKQNRYSSLRSLKQN